MRSSLPIAGIKLLRVASRIAQYIVSGWNNKQHKQYVQPAIIFYQNIHAKFIAIYISPELDKYQKEIVSKKINLRAPYSCI